MNEVLDKEYIDFINEMLDKEFKLDEDDHIFDTAQGITISPNELQTHIMEFYNVEREGAYMLSFAWLYTKGKRNLVRDWHKPAKVVPMWSHGQQLEFDYAVGSETIFLGSEHEATGNYSTTLGSDDTLTISYTPAVTGTTEDICYSASTF